MVGLDRRNRAQDMMLEYSRKAENTSLASFQALWRRNLLDTASDNAGAVHQQLVDAYSEPHRLYHRLPHIQHCLTMLEEVHSLLNHADSVALAIWFHDAVYVPGAGDNEQRSTDWFMAMTKDIFENDLRNTVSALIMATLHGSIELTEQDQKFMVDIDLSSFGMPWSVFSRDSVNVRAELPELTDQEFFPKQYAFGQRLLQNSRFFQSDYFYQHYETQARKNLHGYLDLINEKLDKG